MKMGVVSMMSSIGLRRAIVKLIVPFAILAVPDSATPKMGKEAEHALKIC